MPFFFLVARMGKATLVTGVFRPFRRGRLFCESGAIYVNNVGDMVLGLDEITRAAVEGGE